MAHPGSGSTLTSMNAASMSELVIASRHLSSATTECLKAACFGSLPFTICTLPIANVIAPFRNVHHSQYADDTHIYIAVSSDKAFNVNDCFQSVHRWLDANGLCLNPDKSEAIAIGTSARQRSELQTKDVTVEPVFLFLLQEQRVSV